MEFVDFDFLASCLKQYSGNIGLGGKDPILVFIKSDLGDLCYTSPGKKIICTLSTGIFDDLSFVRAVYCLNYEKATKILLVLRYKDGSEKVLFIGNDSFNCAHMTVYTIIPYNDKEGETLAEYVVQTNILGKPYYTRILLYSDKLKQYLKNTVRILIGLSGLKLEDETQTIESCFRIEGNKEDILETEIDENAETDAKSIIE